MNERSEVRATIAHLWHRIECLQRDMQYADHGAYGQTQQRVRNLRQEIEVLELQLKEEKEP